jgi:hypothetical protein
MCKTTTPPRPASQNAIRTQPPNTTAGAVISLQAYLDKYVTLFAADLIPAAPPALPPDVDPTAYKRVAFSLLPLRSNRVSPYYAGVFDDDTDFSASLVKVAAMFAAGQLLAAARSDVLGLPDATTFFNHFNASVKAEINVNADPRIRNANYTGLPVGLFPKMSSILQATGFGTAGGPTVSFTPSFNTNLSQMIVQSSDPASGVCINRLGYGYISAALNENKFFDPTLSPAPQLTGSTGRGIWLTANYDGNFLVRIPCVNDHPDAQLATTRKICRLFAMIRLKQLPETDLDTNTIMQNLLNEPKTGPDHTLPWLSPDRGPTIAPLFTILQDKIGYAGLGTAQTPNVYSEGLIIKWDNTSQVDHFNDKIDPGHAHPEIRLSGEIAVGWQNLLAELIAGGTADDPVFNPIINVINKTVEDFLEQKAL